MARDTLLEIVPVGRKANSGDDANGANDADRAEAANEAGAANRVANQERLRHAGKDSAGRRRE